MPKITPRSSFLAALLLVSLLPSCVTRRTTDPARTATEQLLLSTAADRALDVVVPSEVAGDALWVRDAHLESYDRPYVLGSLRARLAGAGARLVAKEEDAATVVEPRSGALSIDDEAFLIGIPSFELPVPFVATPVTTPELALFKRHRRAGIAKLAVAAYAADGRLLA
ncbi:MAG: DUF6655 family protein, partial [Planctomycetota bacterium JB042]